jgi:hypothetical protein
MKKCRAVQHGDMGENVPLKSVSEWIRSNNKICSGKIHYDVILKNDGLYLYSMCQRCSATSRWKMADVNRNRKGKIESVIPIN